MPYDGLPPQSQLSARRARVLDAIGGGEAIVDDERVTAACEDLLRAYRKHYLAWHDAAHSAAVFRPYVDLKESPAYRALAALDVLSFPDVDCRAEIDAQIDAQLSKHCPGLDLPAALEPSPACPRCRLRLGESLELVPPRDLLSVVEAAARERIRALSQPPRRAIIERRLADEPDSELAGRVRRLLALSPDAEMGEVVEAANEDAVAWLARALRTSRPRARRLDDLSTALRGRELARGEIERAFRSWLDGDDPPGDDDYVDVI